MSRVPAFSRRTLLQATAWGSMAALAAVAWPTGAATRQWLGVTMGSIYRVTLAGPGLADTLVSAAQTAVEQAFGRVDHLMSTFRPDSELCRLNSHPAEQAFVLSRDVQAVLAAAQQASRDTVGAFDVTVAPLVDAWGFGPGRQQRVVPALEGQRLKRHLGWRNLVLDEHAGTVVRTEPEMRADLSGIAKGYGVDAAAKALDELGIGHFLIEAGGEVFARGQREEGRPWQVAIEQPVPGRRTPRFVLPLTDMAMATSGDYRSYFERDGQRYSHEISPVTGLPMVGNLTSVSVVASTGTRADALGKLIVLGFVQAYERAMALDLAAHFIVRTPGGGLRDVMTPGFAMLGGRVLQT